MKFGSRSILFLFFLLAGIGMAVSQREALSKLPAGMLSEQPDSTSMEAPSVPGDSIAAPDSIPPVEIKTPSLPSVSSTPVDIDREAPAQPVMHYYDKHGEPLETPVRFLAVLDTVTKVKDGPTYPLFNGVSVSANFFDAIMMIAGQQRASFDVEAECSLHNWFFPAIEAGIGFANAWPDDGRAHFKMGPSPYLKVGINYNFLYKSSPDYRFYVGLRAGWTGVSYDIYGIQAGSQYYIADGPVNVTGQHSTVFYGQALAGLKVKLWRGLFMGWTFRYGFNIHRSCTDPSYPSWFTPGYGTTTPIAATFSIGYTFGQPKINKE